MPFVKVNGLNFHYEISGNGYPVIFINGVLSTSESWSFQIIELKEHFKTIVYDCRDQGKTQVPEKNYKFDQHVDDLKQLMKELNIQKANIVGISHGASVAQRFAVYNKEMVNKLVLMSAISEITPGIRPCYDLIIKLIEQKDLETLLIALNILGYTEESLNLIYPKFNFQLEQFLSRFQDKPSLERISKIALEHFPFTDELEKIEAETLIIVGREDRLTPISAAKLINSKIKNSTIEIIEKSSHSVMLEDYKNVNNLLISFLS